MEITNMEIFNAREPLTKLMAVKVPILVSYELVKMGKILQAQWEIIDSMRSKLCEAYGEPDPAFGGVPVVKADPNSLLFQKFSEEFGEILKQTVDLDIQVVELPPNIDLEPVVLMRLERFIKLAGL